MTGELINSGIELMLIGMVSVFVFLTILVGATSLMSKLINRYAPETVPPGTGHAKMKPAAHATDDELIAVISAAVHKHRSRHK